MTTLVYFVAASLDGFIAGPNEELDWLLAFERPGEDHGFADFFAGVDGLAMGATTFEFCLSMGEWPYGERPCWVQSHREAAAFGDPLPPSVRVSAEPFEALRAQWRAAGLSRVWLVGGGAFAAQALAADAIDEIVLAQVPVVLGAGRPLFAAPPFDPRRFELAGLRRFDDGIVMSTLRRER